MPTPVDRSPVENLESACAMVLNPLQLLIYEKVSAAIKKIRMKTYILLGSVLENMLAVRLISREVCEPGMESGVLGKRRPDEVFQPKVGIHRHDEGHQKSSQKEVRWSSRDNVINLTSFLEPPSPNCQAG